MNPELPERVWEPTRTIEVKTKDGTEEIQLWSSHEPIKEDRLNRKEFMEKWNERTQAKSQ